jgi:hypothetical protein
MATKDIKIQSRCDHTILNEGLPLQPDRLTLFPSYPIASTSMVSLLKFGNEVPQLAYDFKQDRQLMYENKYLKIILKEPDLYTGSLYTFTYSTFLQFCPKCLGTEFVDDFVDTAPGVASVVSGPYQLIQSVEKTIVTTVGSNKYYPWSGSGVRVLVGSKIEDFQVLKSELEAKVRIALDNLKSIQMKHQAVNPAVSSDEVLGRVEAVNITQDPSDPTIINLFVQYTSQSGSRYDYSQLLELSQYRAR